MYSFLKFETPRHNFGVQSQNIFATFLWLNVLQSSTLVVQFTVVDTQPLISDTVGVIIGADVLNVVVLGAVVDVVVFSVVCGVPSLSVWLWLLSGRILLATRFSSDSSYQMSSELSELGSNVVP